MVPILAQTLNDEFHNAKSLEDHIMELCREHKQEGRALAFALLVYDFTDNTIRDIIDKMSYWDALDSMSGHFLSVFYLDSKDQYHKRRQEEIYQRELRAQERSSNSTTMSFFVPITRKPTPLDNSVSLLKTQFGVEGQIGTPFVLFFQTDEDVVTDYFIVQLKEDKLEDAFIELKTVIGAAVKALKGIGEDYKQDGLEVFRELRSSVEQSNFSRFIKQKVKPILTVGTLITLIKTLGNAL